MAQDVVEFAASAKVYYKVFFLLNGLIGGFFVAVLPGGVWFDYGEDQSEDRCKEHFVSPKLADLHKQQSPAARRRPVHGAPGACGQTNGLTGNPSGWRPADSSENVQD